MTWLVTITQLGQEEMVEVGGDNVGEAVQAALVDLGFDENDEAPGITINIIGEAT